jgi:hypothetical protein
MSIVWDGFYDKSMSKKNTEQGIKSAEAWLQAKKKRLIDCDNAHQLRYSVDITIEILVLSCRHAQLASHQSNRKAPSLPSSSEIEIAGEKDHLTNETIPGFSRYLLLHLHRLR